MTALNWARIDYLFEQAVGISDPAEQQRFLGAECALEPLLRTYVEELLGADPEANVPFFEDMLRTSAQAASGALDLKPGIRLLGRYTVVERIASGGMGDVYRVREDDFDRDLAVKVIGAELKGDADAELRFLREARLTGQLQHPNVVPIHAMGKLPDGRLCFTMKLIDGKTLEMLRESQPPELSEDDLDALLRDFEKVCDALAYAHDRGVVHRDLKPANIMVGAFGEVQLMDWGIARTPESSELSTIQPLQPLRGRQTQAGQVLGTFSYMAPEQARGDLDCIDARTDVFALGGILCKILTGEPPYRHIGKEQTDASAARERAVTADLADAERRLDERAAQSRLRALGGLNALAKRCLSRDQKDRPANAAEVRKALRDYFEDVRRELENALLTAEKEKTRAESDLIIAQERAATEKAQAESELKIAEERVARAKVQADAELKIAQTEADKQTAALDHAVKLAGSERKKRIWAWALAAVLGIFLLSAGLAALVFYWQAELNRALAGQREVARKEAVAKSEQSARYEKWARQSASDAFKLISEDKDLNARGGRELRKKMLAKYRDYYGRFVEERSDDPALRQELAEAQVILGSISSEMEQIPEAKKDYAQARQLFRQLMDTDPDDPSFPHGVARCNLNLGVFSQQEALHPEAERDFLEARTLLQQLVDKYPKALKYQDDLATAFRNLGTLYGDIGRVREAEGAYLCAIQLSDTLVKTNKDDTDFRYDLCTHYTNVAIFYHGLGRVSEAESYFDGARKHLELLNQAKPGSSYILRGYAQVLLSSGDLYTHTNRSAKALEVYQMARNYYQGLVLTNPDVPDYVNSLAGAVSKQIPYLMPAPGFSPDDKDAVKKVDEAETLLKWVRDTRQNLVHAHPANYDYQADLATTMAGVADFYIRINRFYDAETAFQEEVLCWRKLVKDRPDIREYRQGLGNALRGFGDFCSRRDRVENADALLQESLDVSRKLARDYPDMPAYQYDLASVYNTLGLIHRHFKRSKKAEQAYKDCLEICDPLAKKYPEIVTYAIHLGGCHCNLAKLIFETGNYHDSLDRFDLAIQILEPISRRDERLFTARQYLRQTRWGRAETLVRLERFDEAIADWNRVIALDSGADRLFFRFKLACTQLRNGTAEPAIQLVKITAFEKLPPKITVEAARICAVAAATEKDVKQSESYAQQAVALLRDAHKKNYAEMQEIKNQPDFDILKGREDYQQLLKDMEPRR